MSIVNLSLVMRQKSSCEFEKSIANSNCKKDIRKTNMKEEVLASLANHTGKAV